MHFFPAFAPPYIISVVPAVPAPNSGTQGSPTALQIRLAPTLQTQQTLILPSSPASSSSPAAVSMTSNLGSIIRSLAVMAPSIAPIDQEHQSIYSSQASMTGVFVSTPLDRLQLQSEGSAIWAISQASPSDQLEEMIFEGRYADGLGLLRALPEGCGVDKVSVTDHWHGSLADSHLTCSGRENSPAEYSSSRLSVLHAVLGASYGGLHVPGCHSRPCSGSLS